MTAQFVEYADVHRPGVHLVSVHEIDQFLTDTSVGFLFNACIQAIEPSRIENMPSIRMKYTLHSTNQAEGTVRSSVDASVKADYPVSGFYIDNQDEHQTFNKFIHLFDIFDTKPKLVESQLFFTVSKKASQFISNKIVEIYTP